MTPVHFMGREIGWFVTDRLGVCRYHSVSGLFQMILGLKPVLYVRGPDGWHAKGKV